jgi:hypothetical protein
MNPGCAPQRVFPTHPPDQISQATINWGLRFCVLKSTCTKTLRACRMAGADGE